MEIQSRKPIMTKAQSITAVQAALQTLVGQGFDSASLSVSFVITGTVPGQAHRKLSMATVGVIDNRGDITVDSKGGDPINQPGAPAHAPAAVPSASTPAIEPAAPATPAA